MDIDTRLNEARKAVYAREMAFAYDAISGLDYSDFDTPAFYCRWLWINAAHRNNISLATWRAWEKWTYECFYGEEY